MSDLLVVASPTSQPLCTDVPVPTDGQPQWFVQGGTRWRPGQRRPFQPDPGTPDGPYPFTVAVWQEVEQTCPSWHYLPGPYSAADCEQADTHRAQRRVGAVTATVEVTGPSHHAHKCIDHRPARTPLDQPWCHPDAAPDCWHTPTGKVTVLDEPIPCERPWDFGYGDREWCSVWPAPPEVAERLRKVTA